jgi:sterol desaturase/sphingolipid hydroxylase (fatty acid hydroxylase superfamily)
MSISTTLSAVSLPTALMGVSTGAFLILERVRPGRELPHSQGWYLRAVLINLAQFGVTLATARLWIKIFGAHPLLHLSHLGSPLAQGLVAWFIGTFVFYWWHRLRHENGWWLAFHQIHHSPSRIEIMTSFYKHPIEILCDAALSALVLYPLLGCSLLGGFWYNSFAGTGKYFYHANVKTPSWLRYLIQTPELHFIHHQLDVHKFNYSDLPIWDRLFGTYKDAPAFVDRCGFPQGAEARLVDMLAFKDVYAGDAG